MPCESQKFRGQLIFDREHSKEVQLNQATMYFLLTPGPSIYAF